MSGLSEKHKIFPLRSLIYLVIQLLFYIGLFLASQQLVAKFHLPIPGNLVGLVILFLLLVLQIVPLHWVRAGSSWLLSEMLLFFIPAVVAVINYGPLLVTQGMKLLSVIVLSTSLVLISTAWVVSRVYRWELNRATHSAGEQHE